MGLLTVQHRLVNRLIYSMEARVEVGKCKVVDKRDSTIPLPFAFSFLDL
jgi:hypothetical protein